MSDDFDPAQMRKQTASAAVARATTKASARRAERHKYIGFQSMAKFVEDRVPPSYLIDGILQRGFLYTVTGATGHGKTTVCLEMAQAIGTGTSFGQAECMDKGTVAFLAGENPDNVRTQAFANCLNRGIDPNKCNIVVCPGRFDIEGNLKELLNDLAQIDDLRMVIVDTAQAFFTGDNENDNNQMVKFAEGFRPICEIPQRPAVLILAHPSGKKADRDNLIPRGGSAMLAEIDGNFTIWKNDDNEITFGTQGKLRGPFFEPLRLMLETKTFPEIIDNHGRQMPVGIARLHAISEQMDKQRQREKDLIRTLEAIRDGAKSATKLGVSLGVSRATAARKLTQLRRQGYLTKTNNISALGLSEIEN